MALRRLSIQTILKKTNLSLPSSGGEATNSGDADGLDVAVTSDSFTNGLVLEAGQKAIYDIPLSSSGEGSQTFFWFSASSKVLDAIDSYPVISKAASKISLNCPSYQFSRD